MKVWDQARSFQELISSSCAAESPERLLVVVPILHWWLQIALLVILCSFFPLSVLGGLDLSFPRGSARHKELCSGLLGQKKSYRWKLESRRSK